jgi:uncharacterized protein YdeI (YjbR/CyaY-like superfamily)
MIVETLKMEANDSRSRRPCYPMPAFIHEALAAACLTDAYLSRPPYQKNDYIAWITRAKHEETRAKRLNQMLSELREGILYMGMTTADPNRRHQKAEVMPRRRRRL